MLWVVWDIKNSIYYCGAVNEPSKHQDARLFYVQTTIKKKIPFKES